MPAHISPPRSRRSQAKAVPTVELAELTEAGAMRDELADFRRKLSDAGRATYAARTGRHDDLAVAVVIAAWWAAYVHPSAEATSNLSSGQCLGMISWQLAAVRTGPNKRIGVPSAPFSAARRPKTRPVRSLRVPVVPDVLSFDPSKPAEYPNGRVFTDDVIDYRLAFLTKGECPPSGLKPHTDILKEFPYIGTPHQK
jgi:hypothetical protein